MADTANKRASAAQLGRPWVWVLFTPDGGLDAGDRAHALHLYRGFGGAVVSAAGTVNEQLGPRSPGVFLAVLLPGVSLGPRIAGETLGPNSAGESIGPE